MMGVNALCDDETIHHANFIKFLEQYLVPLLLNFCLKVPKWHRGPKEAMIWVEVGEWILVAIVEVKPEVGLRGEPSIEAIDF